jgi:hypothetical protein
VEPVPWKTVPVLLPLSDLPANALPSPVPAFPGHIDAETAAESWRFLIHLRADGSVADCIPLNSSGRSGATALAAWIGGMNFHTVKTCRNGTFCCMYIILHNLR